MMEYYVMNKVMSAMNPNVIPVSCFDTMHEYGWLVNAITDSPGNDYAGIVGALGRGPNRSRSWAAGPFVIRTGKWNSLEARGVSTASVWRVEYSRGGA